MDDFNPQDALQKGIRAARRGHKEPAQALLTQVVQAEPNNEEAWLWLARVVDDPLQKAECLQRVIALNPGNKWAAEQLNALQSGSAPAAGAAPPPVPPQAPGPSEMKLETLSCPNCGGSVELQGGADIQTVVCSYCGSVLDLTPEQAAVIGQTDPKVKPVKPIELGMEGTFEGKLHQVVGWVRYQGRDEEETWDWDEWLLVSADGEYRWLTYDSEQGFHLYKKITPREPFDPRTATSIKIPGGVARVVERGRARIVALAGELTWRGKIGDEIQYIDAKRGRQPYSIEYSREEIELLEGHQLNESQVWKAFGREDLQQQARAQASQRRVELKQIQRDHARSSRRIYMILAIIVIVFIFLVCVCGSCSSTGVFGPSVRSGSVSGPSTGGGFNFGK